MDKYPYHKNKQQAFQAAQQGTEQAREKAALLFPENADFYSQVHALKTEAQEAFQQIENALEVASEHQRVQLRQYQDELRQLIEEAEDMQ
ncbi:hypothetical protein [Peribacillus kribbensis]|uniref:hypothetical protein n=1 Tax=Peribacillus kribbensis TaxID=356658 RepID=UPI0003FB20E0|nr:hypothetical protein [Peribacillus kribbensis]